MDILTVALLILLNLQVLLLVVANVIPKLEKWFVKAHSESLSASEKQRQAQAMREVQNFFSYTGDSQKNE